VLRSATLPRSGAASGHPRRVSAPLLVSASAAFLVGLDATALNVALPAVGRDLNASLATLQAVVTVFALSSATFLPAAGLLADRYGRRRMFLAGVLAFGGASAVCAAAPSAAALIAARAVQGAATAVVTAAGIAVLAASYRGRDRDHALGSLGALAALSFVAGPLAGGALTELAGWRAVFVVNVPVTALIALLAWRGVPESHSVSQPLDVRGLVAFTIGLAALNDVLLDRGDGHGWVDPTAVAASMIAVAALSIFVVLERSSRAPAIDLRLLRHRGFTGAALASALAGAAFYGLLTYLGLFLQGVLGYSPVAAGLAFLPIIVPFMLASKLAGALLAHIPRAPLAVTGLITTSVGMALLTTTDASSTLLAFVPGLALAGFGDGLFNAPLTSAALAALPSDRLGVGSGLLSTLRPLGVLLGTALLGIALRTDIAHTSHLDGPALAATQAGNLDQATAISDVARRSVAAAFADGFHAAALTAAALGFLAAALTALLLRGYRPRRR
jgi:EmrB/QacA subfamily drug resistance transporter